MSPTYCGYHRYWTNGPCLAGKPRLTHHDLFQRIADIDFMLGDDEDSQSRGYYANKALQAERAQLEVLRDVV